MNLQMHCQLAGFYFVSGDLGSGPLALQNFIYWAIASAIALLDPSDSLPI